MPYHPFSLLCAVALAISCGADLSASNQIDPLPQGPCEVGCTNLELTAPADRPLEDFLLGKPGDPPVYVSSVLAQPDSVPVVMAKVPEERRLFGKNEARIIPLVLLIVYPTVKDNPRPDYVVPYKNTGDKILPHMQRRGERPLFAADGARYPVVFYSHGYNAHSIWDISRVKFLASHGYVVVSIFHGDGRFGVFGALRLRSLQFRSAMDYVLSHPDFAPAIDQERIGVTGSSMGGFTVLNAIGGKTNDEFVPGPDLRIKAGFAVVPFVGAFWSHPFGSDFAGLESVDRPLLAVCGGKDDVTPAKTLAKALRRISSSRTAYCLPEEGHVFTDSAWPVVGTWEVLFFDAWLKRDAAAKGLLYGETVVKGGTRAELLFQQLVE
jgi:dienelactone hydrolase